MADLITLTQQPIRFPAAAATLQPIYLATDVGGYDILDMEAGVVGVEGAVTAFVLDIYTGMQTQTDDGWVKVGTTLSTAIAANSWSAQTYSSGLLRFVRWRATVTGVGTALTFFIRGMARRLA